MQKPQNCRLLSLPAEIRNRIYELSLARAMSLDSGPLWLWAHPGLSSDSARYQKYFRKRARQPALIHVCVQIRTEALPITYSGAFVDLGLGVGKAKQARCLKILPGKT